MKTKFKTKKLAALFLTLVLALGLLPMSTFVDAAISNASTASITVQNAVNGDTLAAYKLIDITYDATTNALTYAWNSNFAEYFTTTSYNTTTYTVEEFGKLTSDSNELKNLLAKLPKYILDKVITPVSTQTVAENGTATFTNLVMGEYFIRPTSTTSVYQLMLQKIEPNLLTGGEYELNNVTFDAKKADVSITKETDYLSVSKNEDIKYTITAKIPTYDTGAIDKSFYVADLLPDGLTLDTNSITVKRGETDITSGAGTQYTLDKTANSNYTFKLSVATEQYTDDWYANGGKDLVITYTAKLNDDIKIGIPAVNTVTLDYSVYPYTEDLTHEKKTDIAIVTTYGIKVYKYTLGDTSEEIPLAGAKFSLYRSLYDGETGGTELNVEFKSGDGTPSINKVSAKLLEEGVTTDSSGIALFSKYKATSNEGDLVHNLDYYLVETEAPEGYNRLGVAKQINFKPGDTSSKEDPNFDGYLGYYSVKVENNKGIELPTTGGTGTVIFTVIGISLMIGAVVLFVVSKKKVETE